MADYARDQDIASILTTGDNFYSDDVDELMERFGWATDEDIPFLIAWGRSSMILPAGCVTNGVRSTSSSSTQLKSTRLSNSASWTGSSSRATDPTIVVFHRPAYSRGSHGGDQQILDQCVSRFDDDVFLVLNVDDTLDATAIDADGDVIDEFSLDLP